MRSHTLILLTLLLCLVAPVRAQQFSIEELPAPPGGESRAVAINSRGDVAGFVYPVNGHTRAALWLVGRGLRWLGPDSEFDTRAVDVNDRLQVVIQSGDPAAPGLLWDLGKTSSLAASPLAINNAGTILYAPPPNGIQWVALNDNGDRLGGTWDGPLLRHDNDLKILVDAAPFADFHPYSYRPIALNNRGQALLLRHDDRSGIEAGTFLADGSALTPVTDADFLDARALSDNGSVIGGALDPTHPFGATRPFLWTPALGLIDLGNHLTAGDSWQLLEVAGINNAGQIAGTGLLRGAQRAFRLTPIRAPVSGVNPR